MGPIGSRTKYAPLLYIESKSERLRSQDEVVLPQEWSADQSRKEEEEDDPNYDPTEVISLFST